MVTPFLPVVAFGRPLPNLTPHPLLSSVRNFELPWLDEKSKGRVESQKKQTPHRTCRKWVAEILATCLAWEPHPGAILHNITLKQNLISRVMASALNPLTQRLFIREGKGSNTALFPDNKAPAARSTAILVPHIQCVALFWTFTLLVVLFWVLRLRWSDIGYCRLHCKHCFNVH